MTTVDLTRRFSTVTFDDVRVPASSVLGEVGGAGAQVERQLQIALVLACAESVSTMHKAFDMTVAWAFDRHSFGRPPASYHALTHRFPHLKSSPQRPTPARHEASAAHAAGPPKAAARPSRTVERRGG